MCGNLDSFNEHVDEEYLDVLRCVHMIADSAYELRQTLCQVLRAYSVLGLRPLPMSHSTAETDKKTMAL